MGEHLMQAPCGAGFLRGCRQDGEGDEELGPEAGPGATGLAWSGASLCTCFFSVLEYSAISSRGRAFRLHF